MSLHEHEFTTALPADGKYDGGGAAASTPQDERVEAIVAAVHMPEGVAPVPAGEFLQHAQFQIVDKTGAPFIVDYFRPDTTHPPLEGEEHAFNDTRVRELFDPLVVAGATAFENYQAEGVQKHIVNKADGLYDLPGVKSIAIARDAEGKIAAFQIYRDGQLPEEQGGGRVFYLDQIGTAGPYQGRGIGTTMAAGIAQALQPDVISTSSANAEMHGLARSLSRRGGLVEYPTGVGTTPPGVVELARTVSGMFGLDYNPVTGGGAELDNDLRRTYKGSVSLGTQPDRTGLIQNLLGDRQTSHVFFMGLSPQLNARVVSK